MDSSPPTGLAVGLAIRARVLLACATRALRRHQPPIRPIRPGISGPAVGPPPAGACAPAARQFERLFGGYLGNLESLCVTAHSGTPHARVVRRLQRGRD